MVRKQLHPTNETSEHKHHQSNHNFNSLKTNMHAHL